MKTKKLSMIVYDTTTGLGYQTREFFNLLKPDKILLVNLNDYNGLPLQGFYHQFRNKRIVRGIPTSEDLEWLTDDVDNVFIIETPLNYDLFRIANIKNVKVFMQYNYEFMQILRNTNLGHPDVLIAPTVWHYEDVDRYAKAMNIEHVQINVPVYKPYKVRVNRTYRIFHIGGRVAEQDRNGTSIFLDVVRYIGKQQRFDLYLLKPRDDKTSRLFHDTGIKSKIDELLRDGYNLHVYWDTPSRWSMYRDGGVMLLPRRYGGLCMPMIEALSLAIPVLMPNISPNNYYLPKNFLYEATKGHTLSTLGEYGSVETYNSSIESILDVIRNLDIKKEILRARYAYRKHFDFQELEKKYINLLKY